MRIRTQCRGCGLPFGDRLEPGGGEVVCPGCGTRRAVASDGWSARAVERCPLCGSEHLYRQRDFPRALGCLLVAIGALLVPWTYGLSLVVLSAVDFVLWYFLSEAVVCYLCDTVFRDARPSKRQREFDLLKHDVLRYGKAFQQTSGPRPADSEPPADDGTA